MALQLLFDVCPKSCNSIDFTETTGAYSITNTGGWGAPNILLSDAVSATLSITFPGGLSPVVIDLFATTLFPTNLLTTTYNISGVTLGFPAGLNIPDGLYTFTYSVFVTGTGLITQYEEKLVYCNSACCVNKLFANIGDHSCECSDVAKRKALDAQAILGGLIAASECVNKSEFFNLIKLLNKFCNTKNCHNCN